MHGPWPWESCEKETIAALQHASQLCQQSRRSNRKKKISKTCWWLVLTRECCAKTLGRVSYFRYCSVSLRAALPAAPTKARRRARTRKIATNVEWLRETENYAWRKDATRRVAQLPCCYLLTAHLTEEQQSIAFYRPVPERKLRSYLGFSASSRRPRKWPQVKSPLHLKFSQSSPRVRQSSPQVRKSLVLCKEKTLRDKVGVIVIIDTGANCIAKKERQKAERKCWNWALKTRPPKHGNFVTFLCMQRVPEWIIVVFGCVVFVTKLLSYVLQWTVGRSFFYGLEIAHWRVVTTKQTFEISSAKTGNLSVLQFLSHADTSKNVIIWSLPMERRGHRSSKQMFFSRTNSRLYCRRWNEFPVVLLVKLAELGNCRLGQAHAWSRSAC